MKTSPSHGAHLPPLNLDPIPGLEVKEYFGAYGTLLFQMEQHAQDPHFGWLDTQPGGLS